VYDMGFSGLSRDDQYHRSLFHGHAPMLTDITGIRLLPC